MDSYYGVYSEDDIQRENCLFRGGLAEVNAWISLKDKGYDIY